MADINAITNFFTPLVVIAIFIALIAKIISKARS